MTDTRTDVTQNRSPAHYAEQVAPDLTPAHLSALRRARKAQTEYVDASKKAKEAYAARNRELRAVWAELEDLGATRVAREIGNISEGRVRGITAGLGQNP